MKTKLILLSLVFIGCAEVTRTTGSIPEIKSATEQVHDTIIIEKPIYDARIILKLEILEKAADAHSTLLINIANEVRKLQNACQIYHADYILRLNQIYYNTDTIKARPVNFDTLFLKLQVFKNNAVFTESDTLTDEQLQEILNNLIK